MLRKFLALVCLSALTLISTPAHAGQQLAVLVGTSLSSDVTGDDSLDAYIGTGGLLLPSSFSGSKSQKHKVANCLGCVWKYTIYCMWSQSDVSCQHAVMSCPKGRLRYRVWFGTSKETLEQIGSVCLGNSEPVTRRSLQKKLHQRVLKYVPSLEFEIQPSKRTLVTIPIIGHVTSPARYTPEAFKLSGFTVHINATTKYRWQWGDGDSRWYVTRGAKYPKKTIIHAYRSPKTYKIRVSTLWQASYSIDGIGKFDIGGDPIHQTASRAVQVLPAGSHLVRNH